MDASCSLLPSDALKPAHCNTAFDVSLVALLSTAVNQGLFEGSLEGGCNILVYVRVCMCVCECECVCVDVWMCGPPLPT